MGSHQIIYKNAFVVSQMCSIRSFFFQWHVFAPFKFSFITQAHYIEKKNSFIIMLTVDKGVFDNDKY